MKLQILWIKLCHTAICNCFEESWCNLFCIDCKVVILGFVNVTLFLTQVSLRRNCSLLVFIKWKLCEQECIPVYTARSLTVSPCLVVSHTHPPPGATTHAPPGATMHAPPEQPRMLPRSNHACPPREQPHMPPRNNHACPPPEQPRMPPSPRSNHAPPREQPRTPPLLLFGITKWYQNSLHWYLIVCIEL